MKTTVLPVQNNYNEIISVVDPPSSRSVQFEQISGSLG